MLMDLRNALMAGKRLPYDAEVEYLGSNGGQYVALPFNSTTDGFCDFDITFQISQANTTPPFGYRYGATARYGIWNGASGEYVVGADSSHAVTIAQSLDVSTIRFRNGQFVEYNGVQTSVGAGSVRGGIGAILFGNVTSSSGATSYNLSLAKIFAFKLYNSGGDLLIDAIPVRKGTVGYLYDRVSGQLFGNAGTGDFVLGPDVVPVEYIESHGTEWIDTGVKADLPLQLEADIDFTNPNTGTNVQCLCGGYSGSDRFWIASLPQGKLNCGLTNNAISAANVPVGQKASLNVVFENGRQTGTIDGVQFVSASNTTSNYWFRDYNLRIFHMFGPFIGNNNRPLQAKLYGCRLFINSSVPVRSFRPVRVGTEGAMMDTLTRRIYRNAGAGAFTYGNDLKYPIPAS